MMLFLQSVTVRGTAFIRGEALKRATLISMKIAKVRGLFDAYLKPGAYNRI